MNLIPPSKDFPPCFHRVTIKALIVKDGRVLLLKEPKFRGGKWELPGGGLDFGEDIHAGLRREIEEELGVQVASIDARPMYVWSWRYEQQRNMEWYYSLVLAYKVELASFDVRRTYEAEQVEFFSKEELEHIELNWQTNGLKQYFNPGDFV